MAKTTILIVDDDTHLVGLVSDALKRAGYQPHHEENANAAFSYLMSEAPALVLLDIRLPGISGLKLLDLLKKEPKTAQLPVIMMTTEGEVQTKVEGFKVGADDYIVKPFKTAELLARIEALLRRVHFAGQTAPILELREIRIDFDRHEVVVRGAKVELSPSEFDLLVILMRRPGHTFSYDDLSRAMSGNNVITSQNLYAHVRNLRKKLGSKGDLVETVYGIGYKFAGE